MSSTNETVVIQDTRLDPDRFILEGIDASEGPTFNVSQLSRFFFARSPFWARWLENTQRNVLNGDPDCLHHEKGTRQVDVVREDGSVRVKNEQVINSWVVDGICSHCGGEQVGMTKSRTGYRQYNLADVEKLIHALLANGAINGAQAMNALLLVQTMAKIHSLIP